jgi:hypothetical protein
MSSPELPLVLVTHPRSRLDTYFGSEAQAQLQHIARYLCPVANASGMRVQATGPFAAMRAGSFFINAASDQMPTAVLARPPKVIASPHIGGLTPAAIEHQALETVRQTAEILQGGIPAGSVNADGAMRMRRLVDRAVAC